MKNSELIKILQAQPLDYDIVCEIFDQDAELDDLDVTVNDKDKYIDITGY